MDGVADCILSTDGDCVVLGAPKVVVELTISTKQCYNYDRSTVMLSLFVEKYNITVNKDYLPEMAAFPGCDYIKRLYGW
jgi:5'-3' exonuclease